MSNKRKLRRKSLSKIGGDMLGNAFIDYLKLKNQELEFLKSVTLKPAPYYVYLCWTVKTNPSEKSKFRKYTAEFGIESKDENHSNLETFVSQITHGNSKGSLILELPKFDQFARFFKEDDPELYKLNRAHMIWIPERNQHQPFTKTSDNHFYFDLENGCFVHSVSHQTISMLPHPRYYSILSYLFVSYWDQIGKLKQIGLDKFREFIEEEKKKEKDRRAQTIINAKDNIVDIKGMDDQDFYDFLDTLAWDMDD